MSPDRGGVCNRGTATIATDPMFLVNSLWQEIPNDVFGAFEKALAEGIVSVDREWIVSLPAYVEAGACQGAKMSGVGLRTVLLNRRP